MSLFPSHVKIFLALSPIDFRKGPDSLLALVRDSGSDPYNGALYVFRAKRADRTKIVWWVTTDRAPHDGVASAVTSFVVRFGLHTP